MKKQIAKALRISIFILPHIFSLWVVDWKVGLYLLILGVGLLVAALFAGALCLINFLEK